MKSNTKLFKLAQLVNVKSLELKDNINSFLNENRYTSVNQFILLEDMPIVKTIIEKMLNKPEDTESCEVLDELDAFLFSGMLYDYSSNKYQAVILEIPYKKAYQFIKHKSESTTQLSRAVMRLDGLVNKKINKTMEHPLAIRRGKNGRK